VIRALITIRWFNSALTCSFSVLWKKRAGKRNRSFAANVAIIFARGGRGDSLHLRFISQRGLTASARSLLSFYNLIFSRLRMSRTDNIDWGNKNRERDFKGELAKWRECVCVIYWNWLIKPLKRTKQAERSRDRSHGESNNRSIDRWKQLDNEEWW